MVRMIVGLAILAVFVGLGLMKANLRSEIDSKIIKEYQLEHTAKKVFQICSLEMDRRKLKSQWKYKEGMSKHHYCGCLAKESTVGLSEGEQELVTLFVKPMIDGSEVRASALDAFWKKHDPYYVDEDAVMNGLRSAVSYCDEQTITER